MMAAHSGGERFVVAKIGAQVRCPLESHDVHEQRAERRDRGGDQPRDPARVPFAFEKAFAEMNEMALGVQLARAAPVRVGDLETLERIASEDQGMRPDDVAVFEWKHVERA